MSTGLSSLVIVLAGALTITVILLREEIHRRVDAEADVQRLSDLLLRVTQTGVQRTAPTPPASVCHPERQPEVTDARLRGPRHVRTVRGR